MATKTTKTTIDFHFSECFTRIDRSIYLFRSDGTWPIFFFFYLILTFRGRIIDEPFTENKGYRRGESLNRMLVSLISVASCKTVEGER